MRNKTYLLLVVSLWMLTGFNTLLAGEVQVSVTAPSSVATGERFRLSFSVNAQPDRFDAPSFEGFRVLSGPSQSTSTSTQIINNQVTTSISISYNYVLEAPEEGRFRLAPFTAIVDGQAHRSDPVEILVTDAPAATGRPQQDPPPTQRTQPTREDIFIRTVVDDDTPFRGQQVIVSFQLYTRLSITNYTIETLPAFQAMWTENITGGRQPAVRTEVINGITYQVAEIRRVAAFPQRSGELRIEPLEVEATVRMPVSGQRRPGSIFDDFFGGSPFDRFQTIPHKVRSEPITLQVRPLPQEGRPDSFSGLVGHFDMEASISHEELQLNDAANLRVLIRGQGNVRLSEAPSIAFPRHLEVFDPQINDEIVADRQGVSGSREFDYVIIARSGGLTEIPGFEFSYFDPDRAVYRTLGSGPFQLRVEGLGAEAMEGRPARSDASLLSDDIRFIRTQPATWVTTDYLFFRSLPFYLLLLLPFLLLTIVLLLWRRRLHMLQDEAGMRTRKARRMAVKRLRNAELLMKKGKKEAFFDEVSRAMWDYVSHKLNIPGSRLNKDNVGQAFRQGGVNEALAGRFLEGLQECEFARFAPQGSDSPMQRTYQTALETLTTLEKELSRTPGPKNKGSKPYALLFLLLLLSPMQLSAAITSADLLMEKGNEAYLGERYREAIEIYMEVVDGGWSSATLYYNLANAWYKEGRYGKAILYYERALRLSPRDEAIEHNLRLAREQLTDRIEPLPKLFLLEWRDAFTGRYSVDSWAYITLVLAFLVALSLAFYFTMRRAAARKLAMAAGLLFLLMTSMAFYAASRQYKVLHEQELAIVLHSRVVAKSSPGERGIDLFVVHEGTKVEITSELMGWYEVRLPNGNVGWVSADSLASI